MQLLAAGAVALCAWGVSVEEAAKIMSAREVVYTGGEYKDEAFGYRLLKPEPFEEGKVYPVVLFLHGAGERGSDNLKQMTYLPQQMCDPELRKKYPCYLIAPQCRDGKQWVNVPWGDKTSQPQPEASDQMQVAMKILDEVMALPGADRMRVYLTGLSMGGYGAWDLALRQPRRFAAVVPICGGGDERQAEKLVGAPIWAWHGDNDTAVPVERSRVMIDAIQKAGGEPKYSEVKGVGHFSWGPAYTGKDNCLAWMFEQKRRGPRDGQGPTR